MDREAWKSLSLEHAVSIQTKLRPMVVQKGEKRAEEFETVAGIDLAYWSQGEREYAVCCVVVLRQSTKEVVESVYSFGEGARPLILETVKQRTPAPELYLFDGSGYLHPRRMGIATHASFYLGKPTIGVAKHYYKLEDAQFTMPANERFAYTDIVAEGEVCGRVLRTVKDVRPVFVSVGNYIDLDTATKVVRGFVNGESHIPMPTRLADIETHRRRRELSAV